MRALDYQRQGVLSQHPMVRLEMGQAYRLVFVENHLGISMTAIFACSSSQLSRSLDEFGESQPLNQYGFDSPYASAFQSVGVSLLGEDV
jgi:hypothetical protein